MKCPHCESVISELKIEAVFGKGNCPTLGLACYICKSCDKPVSIQFDPVKIWEKLELLETQLQTIQISN